MGCSSQLRTCVVWMCAIPLIIIVVLLFLATLALAAIGIDRATESNTCLESNSSMNCVLMISLLSALNESMPQQQLIVDGTDENEFVYWLVGATVCGIVFAFVATFGLCMLEYAMYRITKYLHIDKTCKARETQQLMMHELGRSGSETAISPAADPPSHHDHTPPPTDCRVHLDILESQGDLKILPMTGVKLKKLTDAAGFSALIMLFFSCLFFILAVLCLLWAIAVGYNRSRRVSVEVTPFVVIELLVAVICPTLLFASAVLMAIVLNYVTDGNIDGREALPRILSNVKFVKGKTYDFWIIVDSFSFQLNKKGKPNKGKEEEGTNKQAAERPDQPNKEKEEEGTDKQAAERPDQPNKEKEEEGTDKQAAKRPAKHGICYSCFPNSATWILIILSGLTIILAVSYFVDVTLDTQVTVNTCNDTRIDRDFSCFNASTLVFVDCVEDVDTILLHCFKFYQFGVDVDIISSLAGAFAFYLVAITAISNTFLAMKICLHLFNTVLWGVLFIIAGVIAFLGVTIVISVWAVGYISAFIGELPRLNIINLYQLIITCLFIILVGILMVGSEWVEITSSKDKKKEKGGEAAARKPTPDNEDA